MINGEKLKEIQGKENTVIDRRERFLFYYRNKSVTYVYGNTDYVTLLEKH